MKGFPGVYYSTNGFSAGVHVNEKKYYLGVYKTPERAFIQVRLFKYWLNKGFKVNEIPRSCETPVAPEPNYKPVENYKISMIIKNNGEYNLDTGDLLNLARELQSLRIFKYGRTKALRF